jgi:hypothetical protein
MSKGVRGPYAHLVKLRAILKTTIPQNAAVKQSCETEKYGHAVPSSKSHDGYTKTKSRSGVLKLRFRSGSNLKRSPATLPYLGARGTESGRTGECIIAAWRQMLGK